MKVTQAQMVHPRARLPACKERDPIVKRPMIAACAVLVAAAGCVTQSEQHLRENAARVEQTYRHRPEARTEAQAAEPLPALDPGAALADYLEYAALANPGLEAAFYRWRAAVERIPQARALPEPQFTYRYYIREVETRVGPQRQAFGLRQTVPWPAKLQHRAGEAAEAARAARARYEAARDRLFYRVKQAYCEYYYLKRAIDLVRQNRDLVRYLEGVARRRYAAAAAGHPDVIRAQVELGKLDDRLRTLEALRQPTASGLNAALGRPTLKPLPWPTRIPHERLAADDEALLAWLREHNPELAAYRHRIAQAERGVRLAEQNYYPDATVGIQHIQTDEALLPGVRDSGKDPVIAMFSVTLPVWYEKYDAALREARARHWETMHSRAERENVLAAEVRMVLYHVRDAARKIDLYGDTLVPKARQSLKATEAAYRAGEANFVDLVDAERVLLEFQLAHQRALADHAIRLAKLRMLVGRPLSADESENNHDDKPAGKEAGEPENPEPNVPKGEKP